MIEALTPLAIMLGLVAVMVAPGLAYAARIRKGQKP